MAVEASIKVGFRIRTRGGLVVERLSIQGRDEAHAESKLRQMYQQCEIIERQVLHAPAVSRLRGIAKS
jgi:hypothetical protein